MKIVIAGAHGKIARLLTRSLVSEGHEVTGLIRNPAQADDLRQDGATPVVCDLERSAASELSPVLTGADAVVFAAGAGPGSGDSRKVTVDHGASVLLADAAESAGVPRFVQISSTGADSVRDGAVPADVPADFLIYLQSKLAAEEDLVARPLDWTIVRPGSLTDDPSTGTVALQETGPDTVGVTETQDSVPRADVAFVVAELLRTGAASRQRLHLISGTVTVAAAVAALA
jgi:nucleoside-diphosphate-sugar epimerase